MTPLAVIAVLASIALAHVAVLDIHPLSEENIALINQKAKTWRAGRNFEVKDWERVKKIIAGVLKDEPKSKSLHKLNPHDESEDVPESFDSREIWSSCDSLTQIRDQSNCGSCWALAAVAAMSDRICIHSNQTKQVYVSAEDLVACCYGVFECGYGCKGGYITRPWVYWQETGIVTGGLYNSSQGCKDYSMKPCEHHTEGNRPQCSSLERYETPKCVKSCYNNTFDYEESLTFGMDVNTFDHPKQIQLEILKNGPVEAQLVVFDDFPSYKSGVYVSTSTTELGEHAVKILGWGVEDDTPYWLVANSWNTDWGDNGYFKILRGENHCGIEELVAASLPRL